MKVHWPVEIAGTGVALPSRVVTNNDFAARLETTDEWIHQRTGIRERRIAEPHESTLGLGTAACASALRAANTEASEIDLLICGTITPEHTLPTTSCQIQAALGCRHIPAFDQVSACTGFVWSVATAAQYIASGFAKTALVVGAECMSRITDMEDRGTAILFGDAAGAAVLRKATHPGSGILAARMGADGGQALAIWVPAGGAKEPASTRTVNERLHYLRMNGREVYKFAVSKMQELMKGTLDDAGVKLDELSLVVPHQSNQRIIESACDKLGLPTSKVVVNIDRFGNTSAASVPVALHEAMSAGRIRRGDLVMLIAFGAGLTWGSVLLRV